MAARTRESPEIYVVAVRRKIKSGEGREGAGIPALVHKVEPMCLWGRTPEQCKGLRNKRI